MSDEMPVAEIPYSHTFVKPPANGDEILTALFSDELFRMHISDHYAKIVPGSYVVYECFGKFCASAKFAVYKNGNSQFA